MAFPLLSFSGITKPGSHLTDHEAIADTIHRLTESVDSEDAAMFKSCVYEDTEWDVSGLTFLGKDYGVLRGMKEMLNWQMTGPAPVLSTHMVNNVRSHMETLEDGTKTATATAYVLAQHLPQGTPHSKISSWDNDLFLAANRFTGELKWDGERWRFTRFALRTIWTVGDNRFVIRNRPE
ncbi:hypothetical protein COCC4DRAFT_28635 [Bipolaris maydis ATCC 48331]|uniref:SnoaL-like domain-containing protein n=2 Tax=Cochliobolus heterostrophus TaxID=5016 RepID=M2TPM1_COCH5|nr:uncharacterized protein COCC4DRAFT_28635 [Bipolaris maydis ATCC 48331]EMD88509.1 hypothetical protein COCHEDRAFT_1158469 [Bipolaris maydis C5]KAH7556811.1 hypothetical protein BM1_06245 [Bipolaris maydis]ENH99148.1 hypothetical protein COCC4DRAFT_28635 [Bipolaris maydis ATCC 48331]KAJ5026324.1 hypothetical protein J3E73DRAFT_391553 [Bipolaris maydis]KAJ5051402.1 hypothetical protein J3E74DRAFT_229687 [Bipolaris maydis]